MCSSMLSLKFFVHSKQHSAHSEQKDQRMRQVVAYKRLRKSLSFQAQKVVAVAYILVFWIDSRLWEVVAHGGSAVCGELRQDL